MSYDQHLLDGLLAAMRLSKEPMVLSNPRLPDNPILAANAAFTDLTGYTEAEFAGRNCRFLQGARTDREVVGRMGASLRAGQGCVQWLLNYRRDGSRFWNLLFISPVYGAGGELLYFFANQHDLSGDATLDMAEVRLGESHMEAPEQAQFHALLGELGGDAAGDARSLETQLAAVRQVAALSRGLQAGA